MSKIEYSKVLNSLNLFDNLNEDFGSVEKCQNYKPIYKKIIPLNENEYEDFHLGDLKIEKVYGNENNVIDCDVNNERMKIFIKFSPLLNVTKFLCGKYSEKEKICELPKLKDDECIEKVKDVNNTSYTDMFFCYLSDTLLRKNKLLNGLGFYGSYLAIKNKYVVNNIAHDLEYLEESEYFLENINNGYKFEGDLSKINYLTNLSNISKKFKPKIEIENDWVDDEKEPMIEPLTDFKDVFVDCKAEPVEEKSVFNFEESEPKIGIIYEDELKKKDDDDYESCSDSSNSINTGDIEESEDESDFDEEEYKDIEGDLEDDEEEDEEEEDEDDIDLRLIIDKFPTHMICMENCDSTFDSYLEDNEEIDEDEFAAILMQVIMTLIAYKKAFWFSHNDLHTNNIMYVNTEKQFLYYKFNEKHYKVPTYGKIYKIIDFDRAIFKYGDETYCPDSFKKGEDAATQYNFEPYYDKNKKKIEPNFSFDLPRLATSIFDNIFGDTSPEGEFDIEIINKLKNNDKIANLIYEWCLDDKNRNILYTSEGDERYPEFKLYKMISRTVSKHTPEKQLDRDLFKSKFMVNSKSVQTQKKKNNIINIDMIEKMYED